MMYSGIWLISTGKTRVSARRQHMITEASATRVSRDGGRYVRCNQSRGQAR